MKIPPEATVPRSKLTDYLLSLRPLDDKSKYLSQAGFSKEQPDVLEQAIRQIAADNDAVDDGVNEYGTFYRVNGLLTGPNGRSLSVVVIWLQWKADATFHFVTLKPARTKS
jgi:Domain of unknown function (DUF6883)